MPAYLKPHTREWFEALMQTNAAQAMQTAAIIKAAGREDVCSICGDDPSVEYRIAADNPAPPGTLRLCDDCRRIRKDVYVEEYVPLAN